MRGLPRQLLHKSSSLRTSSVDVGREGPWHSLAAVPAEASGRPVQALTCLRGQHSAAPEPQTSSAVANSLLVDTLREARRFERIGFTREQAEQLARYLAVVVCVNRVKPVVGFVSKAALERAVLEQEARVAGFKSEVAKGQELHLASLTRDTERLTASVDKIRAEIRYEVDKLQASQRLDLNLERGRIRDELQALRDKSNELEIKLDRETNSLKAAVEQSKNEVTKYSLGVFIALVTTGLGAARLFSK